MQRVDFTSLPPTPFRELNTVLKMLVAELQRVLGDNLVAAYLQGSFAVGDFDEHSDADFVILLHESLSEGHVQALQEVHERIYHLPYGWAQHLEGSYFPKNVLRDYQQTSIALWYLDHGSHTLELSDHCNTALVRWVVRAQGVILAGAPPAAFVDPIPVAALRREIFDTIQRGGQSILADPESYRNRWYQCYIVLNFSRMLHDLHNGFPGSKRAGAEWVKATSCSAWSGLIDRSWAGRPDPAFSCRQPADPADFQSTLQFVQYILEESERLSGKT